MAEQVTSPSELIEIPDVKIRLAERSDLLDLEWNGEFRHFRIVYANAFTRQLQGTSCIWIAECGLFGLLGQVFIQLLSDRPELADGFQRAYLHSFRIKLQFRNQGLGTRMVDVVESDLQKRQFSRLTLNVAKSNQDAMRLYHRLGFQIVADEPGIWSYPDDKGIWHNMHEPSWRMEKLLNPTTSPKIEP